MCKTTKTKVKPALDLAWEQWWPVRSVLPLKEKLTRGFGLPVLPYRARQETRVLNVRMPEECFHSEPSDRGVCVCVCVLVCMCVLVSALVCVCVRACVSHQVVHREVGQSLVDQGRLLLAHHVLPPAVPRDQLRPRGALLQLLQGHLQAGEETHPVRQEPGQLGDHRPTPGDRSPLETAGNSSRSPGQDFLFLAVQLI